MLDSQDSLEKNYVDGNSVPPNEMHFEYGIPHEEINSFRNLIRIYSYRETIIKEGEMENALYLLRVGKVEVSKKNLDSEEIIDTIEAVNFFGEMSMINDKVRNATVRALSKNVVVYRIAQPNLQILLNNPKWAELLTSRLARNLAGSIDQQMLASKQLREIRAEIERLTREMKEREAQTAQNTRLALNGILRFQEITQRTAVMGSRGWAYLNALSRLTRSLITHYLPTLDVSEKTVEVNVIRNCLTGLPQEEQNKILEELKLESK